MNWLLSSLDSAKCSVVRWVSPKQKGGRKKTQRKTQWTDMLSWRNLYCDSLLWFPPLECSVLCIVTNCNRIRRFQRSHCHSKMKINTERCKFCCNWLALICELYRGLLMICPQRNVLYRFPQESKTPGSHRFPESKTHTPTDTHTLGSSVWCKCFTDIWRSITFLARSFIAAVLHHYIPSYYASLLCWSW